MCISVLLQCGSLGCPISLRPLLLHRSPVSLAFTVLLGPVLCPHLLRGSILCPGLSVLQLTLCHVILLGCIKGYLEPLRMLVAICSFFPTSLHLLSASSYSPLSFKYTIRHPSLVPACSPFFQPLGWRGREARLAALCFPADSNSCPLLNSGLIWAV